MLRTAKRHSWTGAPCDGGSARVPATILLAANRGSAMLEAIGVARYFGVPTTAEFFRPDAADIHFTSALRYPVFVDGKNYNGTPDMLATRIFRQMVETHLAEEAAFLPRCALAVSWPEGGSCRQSSGAAWPG